MKAQTGLSRMGLAGRNGTTDPSPRLGGATASRCPPVHVQFVYVPDMDLRLRQLARVLFARERPIEGDNDQA